MKFLQHLKFAPDQGSASPAGQSSQAQQTQAIVANNNIGPETRRKLASSSYSSNSASVIDIPRDTCIKRMNLNLVGSFTVTYGGGSPTLSPFGVFARLVPNFYLVADGSRNVKVLDLFMQRCMNSLAYGGFPRRAYKSGAGLTSTSSYPSTEWLSGTIAYPSSTQDIVINENIIIDFENPFSYEQGRNISQLYTKNLSTCNMTFGWGDISSVQTTGVGASVTYSNVSLSVVPTIIENRDGTLADGAFDFNETVIRRSYSSQQTLAQILLNTGNKLMGVALMAQNGDTNLSLADIVATDIQLVRNGVESVILSRFRDLMNENKARFGVSDDQYASSLHALTGFAYINLQKNGNALSGLDTRLVAGTSQVELDVSTGASSGVDAVTYTNPVTLSVLQQQLVPVPQKA